MSALSEVLFTPTGLLLRLAALLLLTGQLSLLALSLLQRRGAWRVGLAGAHLLIGLLFLTALLDCAYRLNYLPYVRGYLPPVSALRRAPWLIPALAEGADALLLGLGAADAVRFARGRPTLHSVKQAVDLLPAGICVSESAGTVLLSNLQMTRWNRELTGGGLTDAKALRAAVRERGLPQDGKTLVRLDDGTALLFTEGTLTLDGRAYVQLTAEDVTAQSLVTKELEEKNARLRALQCRMKAYRVRESELLLREELLSARATVHSQLGGALLTGKYHLEHPEETNPEALRTMLLHINAYLLSEVDDPEPRADALDAALSLAKGIGVTVTLRGDAPEPGPLRELLGQAVAECATNTVKHAGGDRLEVTADANGFTVSNNGAPPEREIFPSGGLSSLRLAVERAGGRMELQSKPAFLLRVSLE